MTAPHRRVVCGALAALALLDSGAARAEDYRPARRALYARGSLGFGGLGVRKTNAQGPEDGTSGSGAFAALTLGGRALPWLAFSGELSAFYSWAPRRRGADGARSNLGQDQLLTSLLVEADFAPRPLHDVHFSVGAGGALLSQEDDLTGVRDRRRGFLLSLGMGHDWMVSPALGLGALVRVAGGRLWARDQSGGGSSTESDKIGLFTVALSGLLR